MCTSIWRRPPLFGAVFAPVVLIITAILAPAAAQFCETPLCREGETFARGGEDRDGAYGVCQGSSGFGYQSHYLARCEEGWTLSIDRGVCVRDTCSGRVCGALVPLCQPTERYDRSGTDGDGVYGVCESGPAFFTLAQSHRIERCGEGWTLLTEAGLCRRDCGARTELGPDVIFPIPIPLPGIGPDDRFRLRADLVLPRLWLKNAAGAPAKTVAVGSAYYICFEVRNEGNVASGAFKVRGGGLGIPTSPEQTQASLAPAASREGCLFYPVTPGAGRYTVELTADADNTVSETREDNNSRRVTYEVR